jgi:hypothetical protein
MFRLLVRPSSGYLLEEYDKGTNYEILFNINNQQDRIICRRLNEVNKMIEPFSKYIRLNPATWLASRNLGRWFSVHQLLFRIFSREHD